MNKHDELVNNLHQEVKRFRARSLARATALESIDTVFSFTGMTDKQMVEAIKNELNAHRDEMQKQFGKSIL